MLNVSMSPIEWVGATTLTVGLLMLLFSPYRRWLGFMMAGMVYFAFLEGTRLITQSLMGMGLFQGYITGIAISLVMLTIWLASTEDQRSAKRHADRLARQVEHRPIHMEEISTDA